MSVISWCCSTLLVSIFSQYSTISPPYLPHRPSQLAELSHSGTTYAALLPDKKTLHVTWSSVISWCCSTLLASISEISLFISSFSPWVVKHSDSDDDYNEDQAQWIASCPHPHILRKNALDDGLKWHISEGYDDHLLDIKTSLPWISRIRPALGNYYFLAKIKPL